MHFCRIENSVEKAAVLLLPMYIIGLQTVPRVSKHQLLHRVMKWKRKIGELEEPKMVSKGFGKVGPSHVPSTHIKPSYALARRWRGVEGGGGRGICQATNTCAVRIRIVYWWNAETTITHHAVHGSTNMQDCFTITLRISITFLAVPGPRIMTDHHELGGLTGGGGYGGKGGGGRW